MILVDQRKKINMGSGMKILLSTFFRKIYFLFLHKFNKKILKNFEIHG